MSIKLNRRNVMQGAAATGVLAATGLPASAAPKMGGRLRLGLKGANTSDTWDGRTMSDSYMIVLGQGCVFECLTEVTADGQLIGELAESWESTPDAKTWTFNLRKGVKFHNGKSFGADDVIESFNLHVAEDSKSAAKPIVANVEEIKKLSNHQVQMKLKLGNADFPFLVSDYHILIYPAGMIEEAIAKGIGTGPYRVISFDPGVRTVAKRVDNHYRDGDAGWFEEIEALAINDEAARINALITGEVDAINNVDKKTIPLVKVNPNINIIEVTGNQHYTFPMLTNLEPFNDINVRKAIKHACNRQEMVDKILLGHGAVANDHPIGPANQYHYSSLEQTSYDPEKAKYFLKKAGLSSLDIDLSSSEAAFGGAIDAALLYQNSAKAAGININVIQEPSDGYWSNVWLKKPWCASFFSGRVTEDWMFTINYELGAAWNDTHWDNARFQSLLYQGRTELDSDKRREIYYEMQQLCSTEGGTVVPMYANYIDAHNVKVKTNPTTGNVWMLDNARAPKRWWMA